MANQVYIGQLNRKVAIQQYEVETDSTGEKIETLVDYKNVWAELKDVSGSEYEEGKIVALNVRKYTIRYNQTILQKGVEMFVYDKDEVSLYNINSVEVIGFKNYLTLKCSKRE